MPAPTGRDLEQTRGQLARWLSTKMPAARGLSVSALSGPDATGFSSHTLMFDVSYTEDGRARTEHMVVRMEPLGFRVFPVYDIPRQFRIMKALAATAVPVPRVLWLDENPDVLGVPFYVMERVEGRVPPDNPPYHVSGWVTEIEPAERAAIWWSGLDALAAIHRVDWRTHDLSFMEPPADGRTPLARQLDEYTSFLSWAAAGRPQPVTEAALHWLRAHQPRNEPVALCWGDSRLGNMIFDDGKCRAVLDWEMATLGSPEQDLAWWLFFDRHHSYGVEAPRLLGFPSREETVAAYENKTGHRVAHLAYYEIFAAFRFAVIMIRVAQFMVAQGMLDADAGFDTNNACTRMLGEMLEAAA